MRATLGAAAMILTASMVAGPSVAEEQTGKIQEVIIKIETPDGPRWYTLSGDLSKVDVQKGKVVRFNYADDTIESIQVEEVTPEEATPAEE